MKHWLHCKSNERKEIVYIFYCLANWLVHYFEYFAYIQWIIWIDQFVRFVSAEKMMQEKPTKLRKLVIYFEKKYFFQISLFLFYFPGNVSWNRVTNIVCSRSIFSIQQFNGKVLCPSQTPAWLLRHFKW